MTCPRVGCGAGMMLDLQFETDAITYGVNKRQWWDIHGHRHTEAIDRGFKEVELRRHESRRCMQCGRMIEQVSHATQSMHPECSRELSRAGHRALRRKRTTPRPCRSCGKMFTPRSWSNADRAIHCPACKKLPRCQACGNYHRADGRHAGYKSYEWVGGMGRTP